MRKLILVMLLGLTITANADNTINNIPKDKIFYIDENGYYQKWERPKKYEDWTYVDENGYDYTIKIIIED